MDATPAVGPTVRDADRKAGMATLLCGVCFIVAAVGSAVVEAAWAVMIVGFALLIYVVPALHRHQVPADGAAGLWGSRLVMFGGAVVVALGVVFLIWEALGTPPEEEGIFSVFWMIGFFSFVIGIIAFTIGSLRARVLPRIGPGLMIVGLIGGLVIDMATGAFFEDEGGGTTAWGFYIGVPIFGLGLALIGYSLWKQRATTTAEPALPA